MSSRLRCSLQGGASELTSDNNNSVNQAAVADGELEQAVSACRALAAEYISDGSSSALDLSAVLSLLAKARYVCHARACPQQIRQAYVLCFLFCPYFARRSLG